MDPGFAVFNGHINNADKRARAFMAKRCPTYLARVEALEREGCGIMYLFHVCGATWGDVAARRYILLVTGFVNEDCDSDGSPKGGDPLGSVHDSAGLEEASPETPPVQP
jgi:hypothetical protein